MSFVPDMWQLRGLPYDVAERYGKPCVGAHYRGHGARSNALDEGARCACCGRPATNSHHCPPLHFGQGFLLATPRGSWLLRPALIALCGSGTTGCHDGFHGGARYRATWEWRSDEFARMWWDGELLSRVAPHSPALYAWGLWRFEDRRTGVRWEVGA